MDIMTLNIDNLGMSVRSTNCLHRAGIFTVEEFLKLTEEEMAAIRNLGRKSMEEIMEKQRLYAAYVESGNWDAVIPETVAAQDETAEPTKGTVKKKRIQDSDMSVRAINGLTNAGIQTIEELLLLSEDQLYEVRNLGKKTIEEILVKIEEYRQIIAALPDEPITEIVESVDPSEHFDEWLEDEKNQQRVLQYLQISDIDIDVLDMLSAKAYNLLRFAGYTRVCQIAFLDDEGFLAIPRMDESSAAEIRKSVRYYLRKNKDEVLKGVGVGQGTPESQKTSVQISVSDMIRMPEYREQILRYVKMNDCALAQMNLSVRSSGALSRAGHRYLSDIFFMGRMDFSRLNRMGNTSVEEILSKINAYIEQHEARILAFISGDKSVLLNEEAIRDRILRIYQNLGFGGLHFPEIVEKLGLPEDIGDDIVKKAIGKLIAEHELEYIDFLVYRVYPSFSTYLDKCDDGDDRGIRYVRLKMQGETLESIAQGEGLTRERIRQVIKKTDQKIHNQYLADTGSGWFDEDYYRYLYTNYSVDRKVCTEWLGIPVETYNYLDMFNTKGKKDLAEALDDPGLDVGLKLKISNYLNRDKIFIDGNWIEKRRSSLEDYVLMKYCGDELSFDDFTEAYNNFLASQGIPYSEDLYYTVDISRTRSNRLVDSRFVLWKQFQRLRYYDIDSRDYTELLEGLNLESYENIELSTLKFIEDYPELMARYDIRDQYELHNLLKKIVPDGSYHDFHCGRMPGIYFGEFDRDEAILDILINNAPISQADLVDLIHAEYGYEKDTVLWGGMLQVIKDYYHMGMYTIDSKVMAATHKLKLQDALTDDFYYIDDVKRIYRSLFPDADLETVNPYNLKTMGFTVLSKYILKNWPSLEAYFRHFLLGDDIVDLTPLRKRFCYIQMWSQTLTTLKNNYEILEFEPNQIISFSKLEKSGITKEMFKAFCDDVYAVVEDGMYFSAKSLRQSGFNSELYDLGFSDWFYANVLCCDPRFSYCNMMGNIILYKGKAAISIKSFIQDQVKRASKIDIVDLMNDLNDDFGCNVSIKSDITQKIQGSEIFYDPILERLYANAELYYRELDADTEGI